MALEELTEPKGEMIGESVIVKAMQSRKSNPVPGNSVADNPAHLREAIEKEAPSGAKGYKLLGEFNQGANADTGKGQFRVQYYKY
jgi:hypothetical protein